jgi:DNA repair protein SbcD/Mre11
VFIAPGNHDWLAPASLYRQTAWPANVRVFTDGAFEPVVLDEGLTLWGMAHQVPAATANPLRDFRVDRGGINVALFHGSEMGWFDRQGEGKAPHAPFAADEVRASGLHHAFLGHYHAPQDGDDLTYPGNPDPLTFGETGPRGAVLVTIHPDGTIDRERRNVAVSQVHDLRVDLSDCATRQAMRERVGAAVADLSGFVRVTASGSLPPSVVFSRDDLVGVGQHLDALSVRVDGLHNAYDLAAIAREATVRGQFVRDVLEADLPEPDRRRVLVTGLRALDGRNDLEVE